MTETKHVTVRVIRTQSLERNKTNSLGKNDNLQKIKSASKQDTFSRSSSTRSKKHGRTVRVVHPSSAVSKKSTNLNVHNTSVESSDSTRPIEKKDSINENDIQNMDVISTPFNSLSYIKNNEIDTTITTDRFQIGRIHNVLQKSKYNPENLSINRTSPTNLFMSLEPKNSKRFKRKRTRGCLKSPCCLLVCAIVTFLLFGAIAATLAILLNNNEIASTTNTTPMIILTYANTTSMTTTTTDTTKTTTSLSISTSTSTSTETSTTTSTETSTSTLTETGTSTSAVTSTSTSTVTSTSASIITSTNTVTTTSTSTTTTRPTCGISCLNQTWIDNSLSLAKYKFENNYLDETTQYNGTGINNPVFVTGYSGQAVSFAFNASQMVSSSYIPLANRSYSIDAWIYPTALTNVPHNSICGICTSQSTDLCLHTTVRYSNPNYYLYHGFYGDDTNGNTKPVVSNQWIHAGFTFDVTTRIQTVYYNGVLLRNNTVNSPFLGTTGDFQIGYIPILTKTNISNMFQGYIDELSVSGRVKSSCELLEQATLAVRYSFDNSQPLLDQGPNSVSTVGSNYAIVNGRSLNAISFTNPSPSYLQATGFLSLGLTNQPFSISFWIKPASLAGTLVHLSNNSLGTYFCTTYLGFASNGSLIAQVLASTGYISISYSNLSLSTYSHIVQTWSSTNGLRLYINNILIASMTATNTLASSTWINYVTIGSCLNGCGTCNSGQISSGQFIGAIDDFRIYIREITSDDVCALYASGFI